MANTTLRVAGAVATPVVLALISKLLSQRSKLEHIPTVGSSTWLGSWWAGIKYFSSATDVVQMGYDKYKGAPFKVSTLGFWMVVVSGRTYVEEFNTTHEEEFSSYEASNTTLKVQHTMGADSISSAYHARLLRTKLSRRLTDVFADMRDEVVVAFDDVLNLDGYEWKTVPALQTIQQVISRSSNRVFVGLPLCRDPEWIAMSVRYARNIPLAGLIVNLFPEFMAPLVVRYITSIPKSVERSVWHLSKIMEARLKHVGECGGSWDECPKDFLTWLMEEFYDDSGCNIDDLVKHIMAVNFASVESSSNAFVHALYDLAANPQYIRPIREEVEKIVKEEGWSKASVTKMYKVDSFIRESLRINGMTFVQMTRVAMKDMVFSDGTVVPKGTYVGIATQSMHFDEDYYDDPKVFKPFRFAEMRAEDQFGPTKYTLSMTSPEYLVFGHGRRSCPGRFFASDELSTILAHIVLSYDVKLEGNATTRPENMTIGGTVLANQTARIMFRKRAL